MCGCSATGGQAGECKGPELSCVEHIKTQVQSLAFQDDSTKQRGDKSLPKMVSLSEI